MTPLEAKLILQAYHPGSTDDDDPFFSEALELARTDKELGEWLERQCAFDLLMADALRSEIPPAGLRDVIITKNRLPLITKKSNLFQGVSVLFAVAASIVLFAGIALFYGGIHRESSSNELTVAVFAREALDIKEQGRISLAAKSTDPAQLRKWLADRGAPSDFTIPPGLNGIPSLGCQSFDIGGAKVTLICFDLGNNQVAHLFVVDKSAVADASPSSYPRIQDDNGLAFATWTTGSKCFVLTGDNVSKESLKKLI